MYFERLAGARIHPFAIDIALVLEQSLVVQIRYIVPSCWRRLGEQSQMVCPADLRVYCRLGCQCAQESFHDGGGDFDESAFGRDVKFFGDYDKRCGQCKLERASQPQQMSSCLRFPGDVGVFVESDATSALVNAIKMYNSTSPQMS